MLVVMPRTRSSSSTSRMAAFAWLTMARSPEAGLHRVTQMVQSVGRVDELAIEIEPRRSPDAAGTAGRHVLLHARAVDMRFEIAGEPEQIQAEALCKARQ